MAFHFQSVHRQFRVARGGTHGGGDMDRPQPSSCFQDQARRDHGVSVCHPGRQKIIIRNRNRETGCCCYTVVPRHQVFVRSSAHSFMSPWRGPSSFFRPGGSWGARRPWSPQLLCLSTHPPHTTPASACRYVQYVMDVCFEDRHCLPSVAFVSARGRCQRSRQPARLLSP
jgi:hypothetical protein